MKNLDQLKTIAVLIDAENAQHSTVGAILDELSKHGNVATQGYLWGIGHLSILGTGRASA